MLNAADTIVWPVTKYDTLSLDTAMQMEAQVKEKGPFQMKLLL